MFYLLSAVDTLFFREATPFNAGEDYNAHSFFPPLPSVYAGAVTNYLRQCGTETRNEKSIARRMKVGLSGISRDGELWLPAPLDVYFETHKDEAENEKAQLKILKLVPAGYSSMPLPYTLVQPEKTEEEEARTSTKEQALAGVVINAHDIQTYLTGTLASNQWLSPPEYMSVEKHTGISIDPDTKIAQDEKMYLIEKIRPFAAQTESQLAVEMTGVDIENLKVLKLGGESKNVTVERAESIPLPFKIPEIKTDEEGKFFKVYLATPAIFKHGWLPWWIDPDSFEGVFAYKKKRVRIKVISAAIGRYISVAGFDPYIDCPNELVCHNKKGAPKPMRYAVPGGSVYYFELLEGSMEDVYKLFHQRCISDYREGYGNGKDQGFKYENWDRNRYCDRGFGYALVGCVNQASFGSSEIKNGGGKLNVR